MDKGHSYGANPCASRTDPINNAAISRARLCHGWDVEAFRALLISPDADVGALLDGHGTEHRSKADWGRALLRSSKS